MFLERKMYIGNQYCAGAFRFKLDMSEAPISYSLKIIEWGTNIRAKYFQLP